MVDIEVVNLGLMTLVTVLGAGVLGTVALGILIISQGGRGRRRH